MSSIDSLPISHIPNIANLKKKEKKNGSRDFPAANASYKAFSSSQPFNVLFEWGVYYTFFGNNAG